MALPFDHDLKIANNNRAYWDTADEGGLIQIAGTGGVATIRARLVFPILAGADLGHIAQYVNVHVIPVGDDGFNVDWSIDGFAIDADGYFYFDLHNMTATQEDGGFLVIVDRVTWAS